MIFNIFNKTKDYDASGYRSPSSFSHVIGPDSVGGAGAAAAAAAAYRGRSSLGHIYQQGGGGKDIRRTPSTSAIYETLRRSKELRESLSSRPSSRMSIENIPDKMRDSVREFVYNRS